MGIKFYTTLYGRFYSKMPRSLPRRMWHSRRSRYIRYNILFYAFLMLKLMAFTVCPSIDSWPPIWVFFFFVNRQKNTNKIQAEEKKKLQEAAKKMGKK